MLKLWVILAALSIASVARAEISTGDTAHWRMRWDAPGGCSSAQAVAERAEWLGGRHARARVQEARGVVSEAAGYELLLQIADAQASNQRRIRGRTCEELAQVAAVVLALAMEETGASPGEANGEPEPMVPSTAPDEAKDQSSSAPPDSTSRSFADRPQPAATVPADTPESGATGEPAILPGSHSSAFYGLLAGHVGLSVDLGAPAPALGLGVGLGLAVWRLELHGRWAQREIASERTPSASGLLALWKGEVRGCRALLRTNPRAFGCGVLELGALLGEGRAVDAPEHPRRYWLAAGLGGTLEHSFRQRWTFAYGLNLLTPLTRPAFSLDGVELYRPAPLTGSAWVGVAYEIF